MILQMVKKFLFALLALTVLFVGSIYWFYQNIRPVSSDKSFSNFIISKGQSAASVANKLQSAGLIRNALAFRIYIRTTGQSGKIQTGEFRLSPSYSLFQVIDTLSKGPIEIWVTIPEGLRREEIATKFSQGLDRDSVFTKEFLEASTDYEGMLFPDTYLFPKDSSASAIVNKMVRNFGAKTNNLGAVSGLTFDQRLVLASILERETKTDQERPIVAGILINRLDLCMPLQVDASVQYALGTPKDWWPILSREDLKINSKFNTYKFPGLPPKPIANPGLSAIIAAFNPSSSDYLYYIHDTSGQIHYAKTLDEHNENIRKYLGK